MKATDVMTEAAWRRDSHSTVHCACDHSGAEHRPDLKTSSPCGRGGCDCQHLRPVARVFYEHRTVTESIEDAS